MAKQDLCMQNKNDCRLIRHQLLEVCEIVEKKISINSITYDHCHMSWDDYADLIKQLSIALKVNLALFDEATIKKMIGKIDKQIMKRRIHHINK